MSADATRADLASRVAALETDNRLLRATLAASGAGVDDSAGKTPGPFFVGGTGRSGTWVVGRLLGQHPDVTVVRTELRFHASEGGFSGMLDGSETAEQFAARVRDRWFKISGAGGGAKGLFLIATSGQLTEASRGLIALAADDVPAGLRSFMHTLVDPFAFGRGSKTWVETTPDNSSAAHHLMRVFPDGRSIDIVRDGRDSAASVVSMPWGPKDAVEALDWWGQRVAAAHTSMSRAPADRTHRIRFEEFSLTHREERLADLMTFAGMDVTKSVKRYFAKHVDPKRAHVGRWRTEVPARQRDSFDAKYREIYARLDAAGVKNLPIDPDTADELSR